MKIEAQLQGGKELDNEQLVLYESKCSVERSIVDMQGLQTQLEEVAKEQLTATATESATEPTEESKSGDAGRGRRSASPAPGASDATASSPSAQFPLSEGPAEIPAVEWVVVVPERVPIDDDSAATAAAAMDASKEATPAQQRGGYADAERYVMKLLKALHVCLRYNNGDETRLITLRAN